MVKTMVVRAGIEVYRQKFLGAISLEKLDYVRNIFYNENSKLMESNFLLAPVIRAEILTNLLLIL
jgi:hypothetical protein